MHICIFVVYLFKHLTIMEHLPDTVKEEALSISDVSNSARYIIIEESISGHCCFEYTIVDTKEGKETYGDYWKKTMCETFEKKEAIEICNALNGNIHENPELIK